MYLAEFVLKGTSELTNELLIQAPSEIEAKDYAQKYAFHWGMDLFSITPVSEQQVRSCRLISKSVIIQTT
jgi:hypothetical protein